MKGSKYQNRFELENLEQRILLSADAVVGVAPAVVADIWDDPLEDDLLPAEEVLLFEVTPPDSNTTQANDAYDPSRELEDLFSGLTEQNDSDQDPSEPSETPNSDYEPFQLPSARQEQPTHAMQSFAAKGQVLESHRDFATHLPLTDGYAVEGLLGPSEIMDTRLAKPVYDYFNDATDPPETDQVPAVLEKAPDSSDHAKIERGRLKVPVSQELTCAALPS